MGFEDRVKRLSDLGADQLARFLVVLILEITVQARSTYGDSGIPLADPVRMRGFNELQHRLAGFLRRTLFQEEIDAALLKRFFYEQALSPVVGPGFRR